MEHASNHSQSNPQNFKPTAANSDCVSWSFDPSRPLLAAPLAPPAALLGPGASLPASGFTGLSFCVVHTAPSLNRPPQSFRKISKASLSLSSRFARAQGGRWVHPPRRGQAGMDGRPLAESLSCGGGEMVFAFFFVPAFSPSRTRQIVSSIKQIKPKNPCALCLLLIQSSEKSARGFLLGDDRSVPSHPPDSTLQESVRCPGNQILGGSFSAGHSPQIVRGRSILGGQSIRQR